MGDIVHFPAGGRAMRAKRGDMRPANHSHRADHTPLSFHVVTPESFDDAQLIADHTKAGDPVLMDLSRADAELQARLIDFASGLVYAVDGGMQRVAEQLMFLTPSHIRVTMGMGETGQIPTASAQAPVMAYAEDEGGDWDEYDDEYDRRPRWLSSIFG